MKAKIGIPSILFLAASWATESSFVVQDFESLRTHFPVHRMSYVRGDLLFPLRILKHFRKHDICFIWFGGLHAFWAVIAAMVLNKKTVIVAGGYDAVFLPELGYGFRAESALWRLSYWAFRHADRVLAVSKHIVQSLNRECSCSKNVNLIYNGVDTNKFLPGPAKENFILTVGWIFRRNIQIKGLEFFCRAARLLPRERFVLVGGGDALEELRAAAPPNVRFAGAVPHQDVVAYMQRAKLYAQFSAQESFGLALAEAMACGCIPVVTDRGALPEVAGPNAYIVEYGNAADAASKIAAALEHPLHEEFRKRILENYTLTARNSALIRTVMSVSVS